jgi:hypothetical protein
VGHASGRFTYSNRPGSGFRCSPERVTNVWRPMRTMFTVYLVLIVLGIAFYGIIGATHN